MKVMIAVDELELGKQLAEFTARHQWPGPVEFILVHVLEDIPEGNVKMVLPQEVLEDIEKDHVGQAKAMVRKVGLTLRDAFHTTDVTELVMHGKPAQAILQTASRWQPDFIVVGAHGRHGFDRLVLGSVSEAIAANATCPVIVVRPTKAHYPAKPVAVPAV